MGRGVGLRSRGGSMLLIDWGGFSVLSPCLLAVFGKENLAF